MTRPRHHRSPRYLPGRLLGLLAPLTLAGAGCYGTFLVAHEGDEDAGGKWDASVPDASEPPDAGPPPVQFANIQCDPPVQYGAVVLEGEVVDCTYAVQGPEGLAATMRCEDEAGHACGDLWPPRVLRPDDPAPLPLHGSFTMRATGLAGEHVTTVWIASTTEGEARYALDFDVTEEPLVEPPEVLIDCGPGASNDVYVGLPAGGLLQCEVIVLHNMPFAPVSWAVYWPQHPPLTNAPEPGEGQGTGGVPWSWQSTADEASLVVHFVFEAWLQMGAYSYADLYVEVF